MRMELLAGREEIRGVFLLEPPDLQLTKGKQERSE
jgi:hypothetical protein